MEVSKMKRLIAIPKFHEDGFITGVDIHDKDFLYKALEVDENNALTNKNVDIIRSESLRFEFEVENEELMNEPKLSSLIKEKIIIALKTAYLSSLIILFLTWNHASFAQTNDLENNKIQSTTYSQSSQITVKNFHDLEYITLPKNTIEKYYKWIDENGLLNITNDPDSVPSKYMVKHLVGSKKIMR